jgi:anaerobic dimethyl sulfoxide reductase subunit C
MSEWPLILFTLAIQLAAGLALVTTIFDGAGKQAGALMRPLGMAIFPLAGIGLLASLWHLGRPFSAWKSLLNLGSSRLSLEILLTVLFVAAAFLLSNTWWVQKGDHRFAIGAVTSVLALAAVASSASIYLIPTQPAWNSGWVPVSFFGTALLLGGCASALFAGASGPKALLGISLAGTVAGGLLLIVSAGWMILTLSHGSPDGFASAAMQDALQLLISRHPVWLGLHVFLAGIVPLLLALLYWISSRHSEPPAPSWIRLCIFVAIAFGAIIGRQLMYLLGSPKW